MGAKEIMLEQVQYLDSLTTKTKKELNKYPSDLFLQSMYRQVMFGKNELLYKINRLQ